MIYLLKIDHRTFAFPDNKGLQTVMTALSRAVEVERDRRYAGEGLTLSQVPVSVSLEAVPGLSFVKGSKRPLRP
jgi:hypothetical protein